MIRPGNSQVVTKLSDRLKCKFFGGQNHHGAIAYPKSGATWTYLKKAVTIHSIWWFRNWKDILKSPILIIPINTFHWVILSSCPLSATDPPYHGYASVAFGGNFPAVTIAVPFFFWTWFFRGWRFYFIHINHQLFIKWAEKLKTVEPSRDKDGAGLNILKYIGWMSKDCSIRVN